MADGEGEIGVDHAWKARLERALKETVCPASLLDALRPLAERFPGEIDAEILKAVVDGQRKLWRNVLYSATGGFDLPPSYKLDWAVAIYVYTLNDPKVFKVINREMFSPERRKSGGGVSDGLRACLPYIRFLTDALKALPARYVFKGQVRRGVKHAFPSPEDHDPERHFRIGSFLMWYEFKSTSKNPEVMTREYFCGVAAGPRTTFVIDVILGYDISKFSKFQGGDSEYEILLLPMSLFEVKYVVKNILNATVTASPDDSAEMQQVKLEKSGFPDVVHLQQVEADEGSAAAATHPPASGDGQATNVAVALGALPAGWQAFTDPQTGCTYYQNNVTKTTQWEHPSRRGGGDEKKAKTADAEHPIDTSGVLQAAKDGAFDKFAKLLKSQTHLSFEDFNSLPPGRTFGVVHQIAFHGNRAALDALLTAHPRVDLKMLTKDGKTAEEVAVEEGADASFLGFLRDCTNAAVAPAPAGTASLRPQQELSAREAQERADAELARRFQMQFQMEDEAHQQQQQQVKDEEDSHEEEEEVLVTGR